MQATPLIQITGGILIAVACFAPLAASAAAPPRADEAPARIGQIFVVGNTRTRQSVILDNAKLHPGQVLSYFDLHQAEENLKRLGIFETSTKDGSGPKITVMDKPMDSDSAFKDIVITVEEANTSSLMFGLGFYPGDGTCLTIGIKERNFDVLRFPTSLEDLRSGCAFRGAGEELSLELVPADLSVRVSSSPVGRNGVYLYSVFEVMRMVAWLAF